MWLQNHNRIIVWLCLISLILRLALFFTYGQDAKFTHDDDSKEYLILAENMGAGHGFSQSTQAPYLPDSFRTPGYPLFLFLIKSIFGSYNFALIIQIFLSILTAYYIYHIGRLIGKGQEGVVAAGVFLFMPFSIMVSLRFLTQTLFVAIMVIAVYYWIKFLETKNANFFWVAAVLLPIMVYVRPIAQWIYLPFITSYFYYAGKKSLKYSILMVALFFLLITPWLNRNYKLFNHFSFSSIQAYQLYFYDAPAVLAQQNHISYSEARSRLERDAFVFAPAVNFSEYGSFKYSSLLTHEALKIIFKDPFALAIIKTKQLISFFTRDGIRYWFEFWRGDDLNKNLSLNNIAFSVSVILERLFLMLGSLGVLLSILNFRKESKEKSVFWVLLLSLILYFAFLSGAVSSAGLRYPVESFIWLLAVLGYKDLISNLAIRPWLLKFRFKNIITELSK